MPVQKTDEKRDPNLKYVDYLDEDAPIPSQQWVCVSFLSPEGIKNCSIRGLKIRGVYSTREEADKRCAELQKLDPDFDIHVGEVGKWLPWDPDPNSHEDQVYQEKELNDLMKGYKDNLSRAKTIQQQRKADMIQRAAEEETTKSDTKERLRKKLEEKKRKQRLEATAERSLEASLSDTTTNNKKSGNKNNTKRGGKKKTTKEVELQQKEKEIESQKSLADKERDRLQNIQKQVSEKEQTVESIDSKLDKIQKLYQKVRVKEKENQNNNHKSEAL